MTVGETALTVPTKSATDPRNALPCPSNAEGATESACLDLCAATATRIALTEKTKLDATSAQVS